MGGKQPVRHGREWARTLPLLFALPMLFVLMGLLMRACDAGQTYHPQGAAVRWSVAWDGR